MRFDVDAAVARIRVGQKLNSEPVCAANAAKTAKRGGELGHKLAVLAGIAISRGSNSENAGPDLDAFEERSAIMQYDADMSRAEAETRAAQSQGFGDAIDFKAAVARLRGAKTEKGAEHPQ